MLQPPYARVSLAVLVVLLLAAAPAAAAAAVRLASPFGDHMVLQRDRPLLIWGTADAGARVTITLGDRTRSATADGAGRWSATMEPLPAGGPLTLTATAGESVATAEDVLIGDVFLCAGQSNMQYGLGETADFEALSAAPPPLLRLGRVTVATAAEPSEGCQLKWSSADRASAKDFSAVAYVMARELYRQDPKLASVPIGMLQSCMGGTVIESWIPRSSLAEFEPNTLAMSMFGIGPSALYNGMIAPLGRLPLAGVVWYQGEGNAAEPTRYARYLTLLMDSWRAQLGQPELPFLIVQLPDFAGDWGGVYWQWIRESQAKTAAASAHAAIAVALETNDGWDLHPQGKHEIGRRLAMLARRVIYHGQAPGRSPTLRSAVASGGTLRVTFDTDGSPLTSGTRAVEGFAVAGDDGIYYAASAIIDGPEAVVVRSPRVPSPRTVRYAWAGVPRSTLGSEAGLPVAPFRTDEQSARGHGEVQRSPTGYTFRSPRYRIEIDGNGRATSLVVSFKQLLSNADAPWGGAAVVGPGGTYPLPNVFADGPDRLVCRGGDVSASLRFGDDEIQWSIANGSAKDPVRFTIALSPQAEVSSEGQTVTARRRDAVIRVANVGRVFAFDDEAADVGGKVLELNVPPGETRTLSLRVAR